DDLLSPILGMSFEHRRQGLHDLLHGLVELGFRRVLGLDLGQQLGEGTAHHGTSGDEKGMCAASYPKAGGNAKDCGKILGRAGRYPVVVRWTLPLARVHDKSAVEKDSRPCCMLSSVRGTRTYRAAAAPTLRARRGSE